MGLPLDLQVSGTPNPNAIKITLNRVVSADGQTYRDATAADAPWAKALLSISGVIGVYGVSNFISVNKAPEAEWSTIVPQVEAALRTVLA